MQRAARNIDVFIALSEFSRNKHLEYGLDVPFEVLPCFLPVPPVELPRPSPHGRPYFLFVGRLERLKGLETLIPVFERYSDADLLVAGEGTCGAELRLLASGCNRVRFLGRVSQSELKRYYANAIALIAPTVGYETFGIVLIEAFSNRTPVLARRIGPFSEIVERSQGGELYSNDDELEASLRRLQAEPQHRAQLATSAHRAFLECWSEAAVIPRYLEIIVRAAVRRGRQDIADKVGLPPSVTTVQ
jgi:glycosyltransferase involved in cell wall biosynthesis